MPQLERRIIQAMWSRILFFSPPATSAVSVTMTGLFFSPWLGNEKSRRWPPYLVQTPRTLLLKNQSTGRFQILIIPMLECLFTKTFNQNNQNKQMWTFVHFVGFACFGWMIWWICHHSIGIIDIGNLSVDKLISNNVLGVCTKYGGHRSDFSFTRHGKKNPTI